MKNLGLQRLTLHVYICTRGVWSGIQILGLRGLIFVQNIDLIHFYIFTFIHGGQVRDPKSGIERVNFVYNLDLNKNLGFRWLTLYFHYFTYLHGSPQGSRIWDWDCLFCLESGLDQESGLETAYFIGGLPRYPESGVQIAYFVQNLDLIKNLQLNLHVHIFKWLPAQGSRIWRWDGLFCLEFWLDQESGLEAAYFTSWQFYMVVLSGILTLGLRGHTLSRLWNSQELRLQMAYYTFFHFNMGSGQGSRIWDWENENLDLIKNLGFRQLT